ncbi:MAG: radical SAM protein [Eubacteriales bacterium]
MKPSTIFYEEKTLEYELGKLLYDKFMDAQWIKIDSHNNIPTLRSNPNTEFPRMKQLLVIGIRKTHKYVENHKVSDFLVPFTSSGCTAMCLYCYLVCNYNKCSYLRLFVNREEMLNKLVKTTKKYEKDMTFEIGSNSDLVLENSITGNLEWVIEEFGKYEKGFITLPTKFDMTHSLLHLNHRKRTIIRMSVNPNEIIKTIELGTSTLLKRIQSINELCDAGYTVGLLIAPVILIEHWKTHYLELLDILESNLTNKVKKEMFIEIIFMTYSYIHRMINKDAFPKAPELYHKEEMSGRGRGKYAYKKSMRDEGEMFLRKEIAKRFSEERILYIV